MSNGDYQIYYGINTAEYNDSGYYSIPMSSANGITGLSGTISYATYAPSIFGIYGECNYCEENGYNLDIGILICKDCLKKAIDKILNPIDINKRAINALKRKDN